jgi:hypothetical protein
MRNDLEKIKKKKCPRKKLYLAISALKRLSIRPDRSLL